jgi:hypothetical protein
LKTFKLLWLSLSLAVILAACNLPAPTQPPTPNATGSVRASTLQVYPTQPQVIAPTVASTMTASANPTPFPSNTPVWVIYTYTCESTAGGSNMTMNLTWSDRSNNEEGYNVYRDGEVIAALAPDSTHYVDIAFVASGKMVSYFVEAFNAGWQARSSTITYGCQ